MEKSISTFIKDDFKIGSKKKETCYKFINKLKEAEFTIVRIDESSFELLLTFEWKEDEIQNVYLNKIFKDLDE